MAGNTSIPCPAHTITLSNRKDNVTDCVCEPGYYGPHGGACLPCGLHHFCPGHTANERTPCPLLTFTTTDTASIHAECICQPGYYGTDPDSCTTCPANSFCRQDNHIDSCDPNAHSDPSSYLQTNCTCNAGYKGAAGSECISCLPHHYCPGGNQQESCTPDSETTEPLAEHPEQCSCNPKYYYNNFTAPDNHHPPPYDTEIAFTCDECPPDSYCPGRTRERPAACPNHTVSLAASSQISDCTCAPQWVGPDPFSCLPCPEGWTCPGGNTQTKCPELSSAEGGSESIDDCICNAGYASPDPRDCKGSPAPIGYYSSGGNNLEQCPANSNTSAIASTGLDKCICVAGYEGNEVVADTCTACPEGSYCTSGVIRTCPTNSRTTVPVAQSQDFCIPGPGYHGPYGGHATLNCPLYHFCTGESGDMQACPNGTYTLEPNAPSIHTCMCNPGTRGTSTTLCDTCLPNAYCPGGNNQFPCTLFSSAPSGSNKDTDCICNAGYYGPAGGPCEKCPADSWCPGGPEGETHKCPTNSVSLPQSEEQDACKCTSTFYAANLPPMLLCETCPANSYCPFDGDYQQHKAIPCPENAVSPEGRTTKASCTCPAGYEEVEGGDGECKICPAGQICVPDGNAFTCPEFATPIAGAASIADCQCDSGYWSIAHGESCLPCLAGKYCPGGIDIPSCPANTNSYMGADALTDCFCIPGFYSVSGNAPCDTCLEDHYCDGANEGKGIETCNANANTGHQTGAGSITECECNENYWGNNGGPCNNCPEGSFCPGGLQVSSCPLNAEAPPGSGDPEDCYCKKGYYGLITNEIIQDFRNGQGLPPCTECGIGYYCPDGPDRFECVSHANTSTAIEHNIAGCKCNQAYYKDENGDCVYCPIGFYCPHAEDSRLPCPGTIDGPSPVIVGIMEGATRIEDCKCPDGQYRPTIDSECLDCVEPHVCYNGDIHDCPTGSLTHYPAASSIEDCKCISGYYIGFSKPTLENGKCRPCPPGYFCQNEYPVVCSTLMACYPPFYREECTKTENTRCTLCNVPINTVIISTGFNNGCEWECAEGYYKWSNTTNSAPPLATTPSLQPPQTTPQPTTQTPHETPLPLPHAHYECRPCSIELCQTGYYRTQCPQAADQDSECIPCDTPENAVAVPNLPEHSTQCQYRCRNGFVDLPQHRLCCSVFSRFQNGECQCLPGFVEQGQGVCKL